MTKSTVERAPRRTPKQIAQDEVIRRTEKVEQLVTRHARLTRELNDTSAALATAERLLAYAESHPDLAPDPAQMSIHDALDGGE